MLLLAVRQRNRVRKWNVFDKEMKFSLNNWSMESGKVKQHFLSGESLRR